MIHTGFQSHRYNGISEATTIRPPATALLTIDSADRFQSQVQRRSTDSTARNYSAYDFTITKNESIMNGFFTRLAVSEVVFPWPIPNINEYTNKIIVRISDDDGNITETTITIDNGFYTPSQLAQEIEDKVIEIGVPGIEFFNMYYGTIADFSGAVVAESAFGYDASGSGATVVGFLPVSYSDAPYYGNDQITQLFDLLGFNDGNNVAVEFGYGAPTYCQATRYVDIVCPQLTYNQALKDTSSQRTVRDALCRIYLGVDGQQTTVTTDSSDVQTTEYIPPGCAPTTIYRNFSVPKQVQWTPNQPVSGYLQFQVYDDNGILLSNSAALGNSAGFPNQNPGLDWSMTLLVTEN
jgi:hypothetical protein